MENVIRYSEEPSLDRPILIEGLPGVGNVGKVVADFLAEKLEAKHFASFISQYLPPQILINGDGVAIMASNELFYAKDVGESHLDVIFLLGDFQSTTPEGQFKICDYLMKDVFLKMDISTVFTLGGYGTGQVVEEPRVLGAASDIGMKERLEPYGVTFSPGEPAAGIVGASGLLLGLSQFYGIDAACIMGETPGYFVDYKSALKVLEVVEKLLGTDLDKSDFDLKCQQVDELTSKMKAYEASHKRENLGYIG